jgi:AraC family transcriptional activator of pobA
MKILRRILEKTGWHVRGIDMPIQLGVKSINSPIGRNHFHRTMHEYFLILEGKISLSIESRQIEINKGDLLIIDPGESHKITSKSPDAKYILLMPRAIPNDKVEIE